MMKLRYGLLLWLLLPGILSANVVKRDTTITWHTFQFGLNEDNTVQWSTSTEYDTVSQEFHGMVLENEYLLVTLVPEFGGRILSIIYKPTGHEQLYQNPCGAPYGIGEEWFYYTWLMVYGGIFPTLPEPEHGKAWLLSWDTEIVAETDDMISVNMSWQDTVALDGINTGKWKYGITNLKCDYTVTLKSGASALQTDIVLSNGSDTSLDYEYWTCLTLAPGSEPGAPAATAGAEMIIPAERIKIPSWYPQIAAQEEPVPMRFGQYTFDVLRMWENWSADGIAYPWGDDNENYWGVINHDNEEGLIRVADNNVTPGIKIWCWGYEQSQNIDPFKDPSVVRRPYIELWAGHSNEFFEAAEFPALSDIQWQALYVPTIGLSTVTHANDRVLADFHLSEDAGEVSAELAFNLTSPFEAPDVTLELGGESCITVYNDAVGYSPEMGSQQLSVSLDQFNWVEGDSLRCTISGQDDEVLFSAALPMGEKNTGIKDQSGAVAADFQLFNNYPNPFNAGTTISYQVGVDADVNVSIYNVLGERIATLVDERQTAGDYRVNWLPEVSSGVYYCRYEARGQGRTFSDIHKLVLIK